MRERTNGLFELGTSPNNAEHQEVRVSFRDRGVTKPSASFENVGEAALWGRWFVMERTNDRGEIIRTAIPMAAISQVSVIRGKGEP